MRWPCPAQPGPRRRYAPYLPEARPRRSAGRSVPAPALPAAQPARMARRPGPPGSVSVPVPLPLRPRPGLSPASWRPRARRPDGTGRSAPRPPPPPPRYADGRARPPFPPYCAQERRHSNSAVGRFGRNASSGSAIKCWPGGVLGKMSQASFWEVCGGSRDSQRQCAEGCPAPAPGGSGGSSWVNPGGLQGYPWAAHGVSVGVSRGSLHGSLGDPGPPLEGFAGVGGSRLAPVAPSLGGP